MVYTVPIEVRCRKRNSLNVFKINKFYFAWWILWGSQRKVSFCKKYFTMQPWPHALNTVLHCLALSELKKRIDNLTDFLLKYLFSVQYHNSIQFLF